MIEDVDIRVRFQDPVDEAGFGDEDDETDEKGEDEANIETFHSQISQRESLRPSRLRARRELIEDNCTFHLHSRFLTALSFLSL